MLIWNEIHLSAQYNLRCYKHVFQFHKFVSNNGLGNKIVLFRHASFPENETGQGTGYEAGVRNSSKNLKLWFRFPVILK